MKRFSTLSFLVLTIASILLDRFVSYYKAFVLEGYEITTAGCPLPFITQYMLKLSWWPYVIAIVAVSLLSGKSS